MSRGDRLRPLQKVFEDNQMDFDIERGGKHPKFVFTCNGRRMKYAFAGTPGDIRGAKNAASHLKRIIRAAREA